MRSKSNLFSVLKTLRSCDMCRSILLISSVSAGAGCISSPGKLSLGTLGGFSAASETLPLGRGILLLGGGGPFEEGLDSALAGVSAADGGASLGCEKKGLQAGSFGGAFSGGGVFPVRALLVDSGALGTGGVRTGGTGLAVGG